MRVLARYRCSHHSHQKLGTMVDQMVVLDEYHRLQNAQIKKEINPITSDNSRQNKLSFICFQANEINLHKCGSFLWLRRQCNEMVSLSESS